MRIAISGAHFTGKSTLITSLLKLFPSYVAREEPYFVLEEQGYEFSNPPSEEDFEAQVECSVKTILESPDNTFFDRCPLDFLAYALAVGKVDIESWIERMESAIELLDLIVFLPIENKDRIPIPVSEDLDLRERVNEHLQDFLLDDALGIIKNISVLEVMGSLEKRIKMVKIEIFKGD